MMDSVCESGVSLLPEKSRLSQTNTATNKVSLIPSHYPPPPDITDTPDTRRCRTDFIMLPTAQTFPIALDLEKKSGLLDEIDGPKCSVPPPPLPPREPTGCSGASHRAVPMPVCPLSAKDGHGKHTLTTLHSVMHVGGGADKSLLGNVGISQVGTPCDSSIGLPAGIHRVRQDPVALSHHHHTLRRAEPDDVTHHNWNALQSHMSSGLVPSKELSGLSTNQIIEDKQCDGPTKMASSVQTTSVLNQVIPLSRWPIGSRQPETHFVLDRVIARPQAGNEYVDSPLHMANKEVPPSATPKRSNVAMTTTMTRSESSGFDSNTVVTTQPVLSSGKSSNPNQNPVKGDKEMLPSSRNPACKEGLICSRCGKCRCMSCTQPRQLPRCWVGPSFYKCECSVQEVVNVCTCLCCVRALFYHCLYHPDDDDDVMMEPCTCCEGSRCCLRWTIMGLLLPFLPCLCLYCPLQCAIDACTSCYNGCNQQGCHCGYNVSSSGSSTTRDLLLDSEPSST